MKTSRQPRRLLGEILIEMCLISEAQLTQALEEQKATGQYLGEVLIARGWATRRGIADALAVQRTLSAEPEPGLGGGFQARAADEPATWPGEPRY